MSAAYVAVTFCNSSARRQHQREGKVSGGLGKYAGGIGNQDVLAVAGFDVNIVVTDGYVRYDA